ncbi:hypothetical protein TFKS16_0300 [Tannerella forsythia KS16]|nr:hypothetical protein TF3313_0267 [Tannerella forsythia 3313]BAR50630.1 hypothetical protein TFKS16_0300 [Tannerella forsythia KS16]
MINIRKSSEGIEKNSEQNTYFICLEEKKDYLCREMCISKCIDIIIGYCLIKYE